MDESRLNLSVQPVASTAWMQLGILVMDGSGSMTLPYAGPEGFGAGMTKGQATEQALKGLIGELAESSLAIHFSLSFISFNDQVTEVRKPEAVKEIALGCSYDPTAGGIGGTAIHRGLEAAGVMVEEFMRSGAAREVPVSTMVILMSDGEEQDSPEKTRANAARLKELPNTKLATCLFATEGSPPYGEDLLQEMASESRLYQRVIDIQGLRKFFVASLEGSNALPARRV